MRIKCALFVNSHSSENFIILFKLILTVLHLLHFITLHFYSFLTFPSRKFAILSICKVRLMQISLLPVIIPRTSFTRRLVQNFPVALALIDGWCIVKCWYTNCIFYLICVLWFNDCANLLMLNETMFLYQWKLLISKRNPLIKWIAAFSLLCAKLII